MGLATCNADMEHALGKTDFRYRRNIRGIR